MEKIKLTKGELKRQRDNLRQYQRYLPTLQLKKQQLQAEILRALTLLESRERFLRQKMEAAQIWAGLLGIREAELQAWLMPKQVIAETRNVAGVDVRDFLRLEFAEASYDLFIAPLWVDAAIDNLRQIISQREEVRLIQEGLNLLRHELRVTSQRVNLFEKIKIPQAQEAVRLIKIYVGDQMANAVGRSKIAKRKIEALEEALV